MPWFSDPAALILWWMILHLSASSDVFWMSEESSSPGLREGVCWGIWAYSTNDEQPELGRRLDIFRLRI